MSFANQPVRLLISSDDLNSGTGNNFSISLPEPLTDVGLAIVLGLLGVVYGVVAGFLLLDSSDYLISFVLGYPVPPAELDEPNPERDNPRYSNLLVEKLEPTRIFLIPGLQWLGPPSHQPSFWLYSHAGGAAALARMDARRA